MPVIPIAPNTTPADATGALAILSVLTDDNKFKQRFKELQSQAKQIEEMFDNAKNLEAQSMKRWQDSEKHELEVAKREDNLKAREQGFAKARTDTLKLQEDLNAKVAKFDEDMEKRGKIKEAGLTKLSQ